MNGWLIVNKFLYTQKFAQLYDWLIRAAAGEGSRLKIITNADVIFRADTGELIDPDISSHRPDYVIFWDKDIKLARALEANGLRLYNRADAIEACDDKSLTCERLRGIVRMPATFNVPFTYENLGYSSFDFVDHIHKYIGFPFILKECFGSFGEQVHLITSKEQCEAVLSKTNGRPCIIQEYINPAHSALTDILPESETAEVQAGEKSFAPGFDIRINVVGDECVASMLRYNRDDFRANVTAGGHMKAYEPDKAECEMAVKVCRSLGLDFAGVDILPGKDGPVLCEVNSNAHFKTIFDCTGVNVAEEIIRHVLRTSMRKERTDI